MRTKILNIITLVLITSVGYTQDAKKETEAIKTKMDAFASKTGVITKFTDTNLESLKTTYGEISETRIRKVTSGSNSFYFYQIEKKGKYNTSTASIEYNDLLEVIKALTSLKSEIEKDIAANPDYLENKFVTVDGFQLGYFINKGNATWYLRLEKYGSENTLFISSVDTIEAAFNQAKNKIELLRK